MRGRSTAAPAAAAPAAEVADAPLRRPWARRVIGAAATYVGFWVLLALLSTDPDPLRLALLVAACTALLGLVLDALDGGEPSWRVEVERPSTRTDGDPRLVRTVALLEAHLSARGADAALRDRLGQLTDRVLRQRHGLTRDDPAAAALLDPVLLGVLSGPPRRLGPAEIDRCLTALEEL